MENIARSYMRPLFSNHAQVIIKAIIIASSIKDKCIWTTQFKNSHVFHIMNSLGTFQTCILNGLFTIFIIESIRVHS